MGTPLKVLIVEDSEDDAELLLRELRRCGYDPDFERVEMAPAMLAALDSGTWDIVISDYVMPRFGGLDALRLMRERGIDLPFIIVSGRIGEDVAVGAMKAGAHDYLVKGSLARLGPAVERELREAVVRREGRWAHEALRRAHDELEMRVEQRTEELMKANEALRVENAERTRAEAERDRVLEGLQRANQELVMANLKAQERAEEALRKAAELDATINSAADGLIIIDPAGKVRFINPVASSILGYTPEDRERPFAERIGLVPLETPDGRSVLPEEVPGGRALRGETVGGVTMVVRPRSGEARWVSVGAAPIRTPGGELLGAVISFTDVTALHELQERQERLTEEAARRAAELDTIIASIADGLAVFGPKGEILRINSRAMEILGYLSEEASKPMEDRAAIRHAETPDGRPMPLEENPLSRALSGETVHGVVLAIPQAAGRKTWLTVSASPIRTTDRTISGVVGTFTDVTQLRELHERQENFIHTISHDLRSPLAIIQGQAHVLQRMMGKSGTRRRSTDYIIMAARRMNVMIKDLVDLTRLDSEQLQLEKQPLDFRSFVYELLARYDLVVAQRKVSVEIPSELPLVDADLGRLERILINLISNAVKYTSPETEVRLKAEPMEKEVVISVADKGAGIDAEDLPHIFNRFYRAKGGRQADGVGLGLYITRMLVEAHGGRIWAESRPEEGSTFNFTLPVA